LGWLGLAWDIKTPEHLEARDGLTVVDPLSRKGRPQHLPTPPAESCSI